VKKECPCARCVKGREFFKRTCVHCGGKPWTSDYMLKDSVWSEAGLKPRDLCCIQCAEVKLGRDFTINDFADVPVNNAIRLGYRMGLRNPAS